MSTIKLPILKKGEYDIWAMKMEHYLSHTDYPIWEIIQKGNGLVSVSTDTNRVIKVLPPKITEEILARERKERTTLLMALPEDHLVKFHKMTDAKEMWDAIKSRFGGNDESKKMHKYILKQQFEHFSVSNSEGLHKGYDRSLPSSWSQISLVMRTKPGVDSLSFDDLYNNLKVFESDVKGSIRSTSSAQNVAFVSSESTSSTNDINTAYDVSTSFGYNSQRENSSSYTNELMYSFFANQSSGPHLDHEDLEQLDEFDLEEMDLKWQVAMISMRLKKFYKNIGKRLQFNAKEPVGSDKTKVECFNCHNTWYFVRECRSKGNQESKRRNAGNTGYRAKDNGRRPGKQEEPKALVTLDGEGSNTKVTSYSKECVESYAKLKKLYDEQREQLGDASIEIHAYTLALKKVEAQLVTHQKNQLWYKEKIRFMKIDLDDKTDISKRDKSGLGSSDVEDRHVNDRFANVEGMHAVPPPMTGNYMPSGPDREVDDSIFSHLIRDCDFHEKRMAKQVELNKKKGKGTGQGENRPMWNNVQRLNHQNQFVPTAVLTRTGRIPVNTASHNFNSQAVSTSAARKVNVVRPIVNENRSRNNFHKTLSPIRRAFNRTTAPRTKFSNQKVNTTEVKAVSAVGGKKETAVKPSAGCNWRPKRHYWNKFSKYNGGSNSRKSLKNKGIVDSGCSRHMTGNKAYLAEYRDYNGGPVAFGGSKGYITGKGKIKTGKLDFEDVCFVKELQ
ncbi:hypothetical protein Tco_1228495 [Tanacetum coccineum]